MCNGNQQQFKLLHIQQTKLHFGLIIHFLGTTTFRKTECKRMGKRIYGIRSFAYRILHPYAASRLRLPRIWNTSFTNNVYLFYHSSNNIQNSFKWLTFKDLNFPKTVFNGFIHTKFMTWLYNLPGTPNKKLKKIDTAMFAQEVVSCAIPAVCR